MIDLIRLQPRSAKGLLPFVLTLPVVLLTGLIAALGDLQLALLWTAALGGMALLALSSAVLTWSVVVASLLIVGQAMYFAGLGQAVWIPFGLGLLLYFRVPMAYASSPFATTRNSPPLAYAVLAFIGVVVLSLLINAAPVLQAVRAAKSYLLLWSLFFLVAYWGVSLDTLGRIWRFCIAVALLQLPLVLYQYFFVAAGRSNQGGRLGLSWDAIVGGFGGDPMGGGASGTMAWFLVFVLVFCVALYRRQLIGKPLLGAVLAVSGVCIGLAEVKVVVVLLPLGMAALLIPYLSKRPVTAVFGLLLSLIGAFALLVLYGYLRSKTGQINLDAVELLTDAFWYSLDPRYINYVTGEMGRLASVVHWWQENGLDDPVHTLFGHGPGASAYSALFGAGEEARRYPFQINRSTLSIFLWDIGIVGITCYLFIIVGGMRHALAAARSPASGAFQSATLEAIFGGLFMTLVMLPYGKDVTEVPAFGVLLMLFLGYVSQSVSRASIKTKGEAAHG